MSHFNFTESMERTIAEFDNLPAASKEDYFRMKEKRQTMTDTPTRKDKGKAMKPSADATHCGGYPIATPMPDLAVPRYALKSDYDDDSAWMAEAPKGGYVKFQDYLALAAELKAAKAERDALSRALSYFLATDPDNPGRWEYNREFAERMANKQLEKIARKKGGEG